MPAVSYGVTEILVAIGDSYWRCVTCHLHFSKLTSIDEHVRQKHGHSNGKSGFSFCSPKISTATPKVDSGVCTVSLEDSRTGASSPMPAVFKINLDNPGTVNRCDAGSSTESVAIHNSPSSLVQSTSKSSAELVPSKCQTSDNHTIGSPTPKIGEVGQYINSETDNVSPFTNADCLTSDMGNDVPDEHVNVPESQLEQEEDCEDVEDLEDDGNVSKAMLASMLSLLEKNLEMDDISSVFQNWDSVSPEFFEQQLLNHSDLSDNLPDNIDDSLDSFPKEVKDGNKDIIEQVQPQSCSKLLGKSGGASKKPVLENGNVISALDHPSVKKCVEFPPVDESHDLHMNVVDENSIITELDTNSEFDTMDLDDHVYFEEEEDIPEEHQAETSDPAALQAVKSFMKFSSTQSKIFDLMSSLLFDETCGGPLEEISCGGTLRSSSEVFKNKRDPGVSDIMEKSVPELRDKCFEIGTSRSMPPLSSGSNSAYVTDAKEKLSFLKEGSIPTAKSMLSPVYLKKSRSKKCAMPKLKVSPSLSQASNSSTQSQRVKTSVFSNLSNESSSLRNKTKKLQENTQSVYGLGLSENMVENHEITLSSHTESERVCREKNNALKIPKTFLPISEDRKRNKSTLKTLENKNKGDACYSPKHASKFSSFTAAELHHDIDKESCNRLHYSKSIADNNISTVQKGNDQRVCQTQPGKCGNGNLKGSKRAASVLTKRLSKQKKAKIEGKENQRALKGLKLSSKISLAHFSFTKLSVSKTQLAMSGTANMEGPSQVSTNKYICTICDAEFSSAGALQRHMRVNFTLTKPGKCKVCQKKFHCLSELNVHVHKCHERLGNPLCMVCYVECSSTKYLLQHIRKHQKAEAEKARRHQDLSTIPRERIKSKYWRCEKCQSIILNRMGVIKAHMCIVSTTCKQCNMDFPNVHTFKLHMASHQRRMFECNTCGERFKNKTTRDAHKLTHQNFLCQICGKQFAQKYQLTRHAKLHSQVPKAKPDYTCTECNKVYKTKRSLQMHIKLTHLGIKEHLFKCSYCEHEFANTSQLREHVAWQHFGEKPHHCRYCDKTFVCRPTMIRHERNEHTGSKPYKCRFCPEAFVEKKLLDTHEVKQHTLVFPYKCSVCDKGFVQRSHLRSHVLTHKKHKPHQCHICGSCFSKPCHLRRHTETCQKKHCNPTKKTAENAPPSVIPPLSSEKLADTASHPIMPAASVHIS